jgi:hypothetical protein
MTTTTPKDLADQIRDEQVTLIASTSRMLDAAEDVRRHRDRLFRLLGAAKERGLSLRTARELEREQQATAIARQAGTAS